MFICVYSVRVPTRHLTQILNSLFRNSLFNSVISSFAVGPLYPINVSSSWPDDREFFYCNLVAGQNIFALACNIFFNKHLQGRLQNLTDLKRGMRIAGSLWSPWFLYGLWFAVGQVGG